VGTDGRVDPGQVGAGEAEALVVARIALDENERLAALVGQPQASCISALPMPRR